MVNMIHNGEKLVFVDQVVDEFKDLEDQKQPINLVVSGSSIINNNGVCIQLGSTAEELEKALEKVPPEAIGEILMAIAQYISKNNKR